MNRKALHYLALLLIVGVAFMAGRCGTERIDRSTSQPTASQPTSRQQASQQQASRWTCPMHPPPLVDAPEFGTCPYCGMDLVPLRQFRFDREMARLAGVQTAKVQRRVVTRRIRMTGKVAYDETRKKTISARVPGRLDRLFVDYTGVRVRRGDHLVSLYSPELLTAQQELLEAKKRVDATSGEASQFLRDSNQRAYQASRRKLLLWGVTKQQVDALEQRGKADDHMLITSPIDGVVLHKARNQGEYVQTGTPIYHIAELSTVWVLLDAYEQDLSWLRYGQQASILAEAYPGEAFVGWISFVDPILNERTRTVKLRVTLANKAGRLKPGMFVRAEVMSRVAQGGKVLAERLRGKWISPMHPEVVSDKPGKCSVCGMPLVRAEDLGYVVEAKDQDKPLVVPVSAVMPTGRRAIVYVQVESGGKTNFQAREIVLGPRGEDVYVVRSGLREGEVIAVSGVFRIDSAMQIHAEKSMLSLPESPVTEEPQIQVDLQAAYRAYFIVQDALAKDDWPAAQAGFVGFGSALQETPVPPRAEDLFAKLRGAAGAGGAAKDIVTGRKAFLGMSEAMIELQTRHGHGGQKIYYRMHCPMAFEDTGADWLQDHGKLLNPYYGAEMLRCGFVKSKLPPR